MPIIEAMAGLTLHRSVDPKLTEQFLLSQAEVLDASVWISGDRMHAYVTVGEYATWTKGSLQMLCMESLGPEQTPREMTLVATGRIAA